jgi:hypothetical protein
MLPVRWPPPPPAPGRWTSAQQRRFTAWHEAGHAVAWLHYRHVPRRVELFDPPRPEPGTGRATHGLMLPPARIEPRGRWLTPEDMTLTALLYGVAAEALAGNPDPWPYALADIEAAVRLLARKTAGRPRETEVLLMLRWAGVCTDIVEPETRRCLAFLAQALIASPRPSPSGWWLMCRRAARLLHTPDIWRGMAAWPGAREAGAGLFDRALARLRAPPSAPARAQS